MPPSPRTSSGTIHATRSSAELRSKLRSDGSERASPTTRFVIASEIDRHHDRLRYRWDMVRNGRTLMEGLDVVTLDPSSGLITRVDGFFGHPTPIDNDHSGIPRSFRAVPATEPA